MAHRLRRLFYRRELSKQTFRHISIKSRLTARRFMELTAIESWKKIVDVNHFACNYLLTDCCYYSIFILCHILSSLIMVYIFYYIIVKVGLSNHAIKPVYLNN